MCYGRMMQSVSYSGPDGILYLSDAEHVLGQMEPASVDMIYIDPPFFSNRIIRHPPRTHPGDASFNDQWDSMAAYVSWLSGLLRLSYRALSDTGSIFVHLDWHACHYIKVEMDSIFGYENFINEIIWFYKTGGAGRRSFSRKHDNILFYSKGTKYRFTRGTEKSYLKYKYGFSNIDIKKDENGYYTEVLQRDVWDIPALRGNQPENTHYPTQKPESVVERMVKATTCEGSTVADFFCGSGTLPAVAARTGRRWIACDSSPQAFDVSRKRLSAVYGNHSMRL